MTRLAAGLLLIGLLVRPANGATPEDGRRAYDAGHFTDAMGIWADLAKQGNAPAEFGLGLLYDLGNGTPPNKATAFFWYKMAADAGLPEAEFNVAALLDAGAGVPQDSQQAALWYAKAAAHGHARAQYDLGLLYRQGVGVPANQDAASAWLRLAADGGVTAAAAQGQRPNRDRMAGALAPVTLAAPAANSTLNGSQDAEFVWIAPPEPQPVRYQVQVGRLGDSDIQTVFTASVAQTAVLAKLPDTAGFYVWSVDTVGTDGARAHSDWNWFSVGPAAGDRALAPRASR